MMNRIKKGISLFIGVLILLTIVGCNNQQNVKETVGEENAYEYDGSLSFTGLDEEFEILYNDIFKMEKVTRHMKNISSSGEEKEVDVTGVLLEKILADKGLSQKDFSSIRLIAGDGYAIDVPADIIGTKGIVLAYEFDNKPLEDKQQPIRVAINDVRSMYYVSNLKEINFGGNSITNVENISQKDIKKIVLIESASKVLEKEEYTYYDSIDLAVKTEELMNIHNKNNPEQVVFVAADGFEKTEKFDVFMSAYIKITGENAPLFISPDLPKGMQVKNIMSIACDDTKYISAMHLLNEKSSKKIGEDEGASLEEISGFLGLNGEAYLITAADGYSTEISKDDLAKGILYEADESLFALKFEEGVSKSANVKDILSIEAVQPKEGTESKKTTDNNEKKDTEVKLGEWTITVDGLSDGSFDFISGKAQRNLELISTETKRVKNDKEIVENWQGYKVLDILSFLHVEAFNSIIVMANDGYEVAFTKEDVNENMLLGVIKNGEPLNDETNLVQLVSKDLMGNKWVKGVAKITVK